MASGLFRSGGYQSLDGNNGLETMEEEIAFSSEEGPSDKPAARFDHIQNLDEFFTRVYKYHQRGGLFCMALEEVFQLFQLAFVVTFSVFLMECVNYQVLFRNALYNGTKTRLSDAVIPPGQCAANLNAWVVFAVLVSCVVWLMKLAKVLYNLVKYTEIRDFYLVALKVTSSELPSLTWPEVQGKLLGVQQEYQLCVHKRELNELDIYNRILRFENYLVAMINKDLLPLKLQLPLIGEYVFFSRWLKYNIKTVLFWFPYWGLFENHWHLKAEYKHLENRGELTAKLRRKLLIFGILNIVLLPLILLWQVLLLFFKYAELVKRDPSLLGARRWSEFARVYLRHFNELEHELEARLVRAYEPAARYMNCFTSRFVTVLAKNVMFFAGALLVVLIILSVMDEDVLHVEHVLTGITLLGITVTVCRACIPDENQIWCPALLLKKTLCHIHYLPDSWQWRDREHKAVTRNNFATLFQYKFTFILEEMLSPLLTPFMLLFVLPDRCGQLIDFFRNFTVEVPGVGDVCSFAQLDVRTHGDPGWSLDTEQTNRSSDPAQVTADGKTELSLLHFHLTNPRWQPTRGSVAYLEGVRRQAQSDLTRSGFYSQQLLAASFKRPEEEEDDAVTTAAAAAAAGGGGGGVDPLLASQYVFSTPPTSLEAPGVVGVDTRRLVGGISRLDHQPGQSASSLAPAALLTSCLYEPCASVNFGQQQQQQVQQQQQQQQLLASSGLQHSLAAEMSVSALYLHELHRQRSGRHRTALEPMAEDETEAPA